MQKPPVEGEGAALDHRGASGWQLPEVHPEGRKFVLGVAAAAFLSYFIWSFLTWPLIGLAVAVAAFFRDPVRVTPLGDDLLVSPADGVVMAAERVPVPAEIAGDAGLGAPELMRVSIRLGLADVHINRTPIAGTVRQLVYSSGRFQMGDGDKSAERERQHIVIEGRDHRRIGLTQIAGTFARRIVSFVKPGDMVAAGQRLGLIRFGSRVDLYVPDDMAVQVVAGQRVVAGETVIARTGGAPLPRVIRH
ncbi:phosphatidylserine decarboxylase [Sphingomonas sp.]|uniref:phosphatidylserine decarboxylase n=1 Tax=Sphingomonas sp. TaxID=28214 RepID=UPI001D781C1D|nr:phosphatidylserine decarboxylase [Sphingomonas sp.]MBX9797729.1 phosphatidylserine decarboxylase [Sphingomonas sp.]